MPIKNWNFIIMEDSFMYCFFFIKLFLILCENCIRELRVVFSLCSIYSRIMGQQQQLGGVQVPQQVQMAVGRAVTNAAINELSNAFKFHK